MKGLRQRCHIGALPFDMMFCLGERDYPLYGFAVVFVLAAHVARSLIAYFFEHLPCALVSGRVFYGENHVFVVEVFRAEEEDVGPAFVLRVVRVFAIVAVAAVLALGSLFFFFGNAVGLFLCMLAAKVRV